MNFILSTSSNTKSTKQMIISNSHRPPCSVLHQAPLMTSQYLIGYPVDITASDWLPCHCSSLIVLLSESEIPEELGVDSLQGRVLVASRFLDPIAVRLHSLIVGGVVLRFSHVFCLGCDCTDVYLISVTICSLIFFICPH